ncbi:transposable element Tcb1 transposase [Trichonephila clavipes]|nr:transposable element Tcb1 transposase [Trichonephila clavipes]
MKLSLLTNHASVCNTTMVGFKSEDTCEMRMLKICVMHRRIGPAPGIMVLGSIGHNSLSPLVRISSTFNSQGCILRCWSQLSSLTFRACPQPYFNRIMRDHSQHALFKGSSLITRLSCFPDRLALQIFCKKKTCGPWLLKDGPRLHLQLPHQNNFGYVWKLLGLMYTKDTSNVSLNAEACGSGDLQQ